MSQEKAEAEIARLKEKLAESEGFEKEVFGILGMPWYPGCKCHSGAQSRIQEAIDLLRRHEGTVGCPVGESGELGPPGAP